MHNISRAEVLLNNLFQESEFNKYAIRRFEDVLKNSNKLPNYVNIAISKEAIIESINSILKTKSNDNINVKVKPDWMLDSLEKQVYS